MKKKEGNGERLLLTISGRRLLWGIEKERMEVKTRVQLIVCDASEVRTLNEGMNEDFWRSLQIYNVTIVSIHLYVLTYKYNVYTEII